MTSVAKGTMYLMVSQLVFMLSGYVIHFGLGRYLGPEAYGIFGVVIYLMTTVNLILTSGFPSAASKYIAEKNNVGSIMRVSKKINIILSILVFIVYLSLSKNIALIFNDISLLPYIRMTALGIPFYTFYTLYGGFLNGFRLFDKQAIIQVISSVSKVFFAFFLVLFGFEIYGAVGAYIIAAFIGFIIAYHYTPKIKMNGDFPARKLINFAIPITLYSVGLTLLMNIDLFSIKALLGSSIETGFYTSATTIARVPFFLLSALAATLFPSISFSTSKNDKALTSRYITTSLRYMLILLVPILFIASSTSDSLVSLLYSSSYIEAGLPLSILIFGLGFLAVFNVLSTIISASGKPTISFSFVFALVFIDIILNRIFIPEYGLKGAAIATTFTMGIGLVLASVYVYKKFKTLVDYKSFIRVIFASLVVYMISCKISVSGILLLLEYMILFGLYFLILIGIKELKKDDLKVLEQILPFNIR